MQNVDDVHILTGVFSMAAATLTEALKDALTLAQAAHYFSPVPHVSCVQRWATSGTRGVKLRTWLSGGRRVTTPAAIEEFLRALNADSDSPADTDDDVARRAKEAGRALEKIGA
jgi:hypothetical protein